MVPMVSRGAKDGIACLLRSAGDGDGKNGLVKLLTTEQGKPASRYYYILMTCTGSVVQFLLIYQR
jgi:hypothetical protein